MYSWVESKKDFNLIKEKKVKKIVLIMCKCKN